jgi:hypothetical protein
MITTVLLFVFLHMGHTVEQLLDSGHVRESIGAIGSCHAPEQVLQAFCVSSRSLLLQQAVRPELVQFPQLVVVN